MSEESELTKTSTTAINVEVNAKEITSIWDDDMVEKYTDEAGKKGGGAYGASNCTVHGVPQKLCFMLQKCEVKI